MPARGGALGAFRVPNFTRYFAGQLVSNTGTWFQNLAISLIVVQLTGSASALALVTVAQFGPILLLAGAAGRLADTVSPRTILAATSAIAVIVTCGLAIAVAQETPSLPWVYGLIAVLLIRPADLHARILPEGRRATVRENLREVRSNRTLLVILVVNVIVTVAAMNMNVVLTSVVSIGFDGDAGALGATHALNAVGAVIGGVLLTRYAKLGAATLVPACLLFAATLAVNAAVPTLALFLVAAPLLGLGLGVYQGVLNSSAQQESPPHALGRTMSLVTLGQQGVAPIGALLVGVLIDLTSGQTALGVGAAVTAMCGAVVYLVLVRGRGAARAEVADA